MQRRANGATRTVNRNMIASQNQPKRKGKCAYCGKDGPVTKDHVIPKSLYPTTSSVQRITVKTCYDCNNGIADDEAHFRNIILVAGEANEAVTELWQTAMRGFRQTDGKRRFLDFEAQLQLVEVENAKRHMVYPGQDERVVRVIKKIIRGLCHYHKLLSPIPESQVWADISKFKIPIEYLEMMQEYSYEPEIVSYKYFLFDEVNEDREDGLELLHSFWLITFFQRTTFIASVFNVENTERL